MLFFAVSGGACPRVFELAATACCALKLQLLLWPDKLRPEVAISKDMQARKTVQGKGEVGPTDLLVIAELITNYLTVSISAGQALAANMLGWLKYSCQRNKNGSCIVAFLLVSCFFGIGTAAAELIPKPAPVEMLDAVGVDASLRVYLIQGKPWEVTEDETLVKILHRLPDFPRMLTERWAFPWDAEAREAVVADPSAWLGQFFQLRFTVLTLQKESLSPEGAKRFGFTDYYRLRVKLASSPATDSSVTIFTREVPLAWKRKIESDKTGQGRAVAINETGSAVAMFLKTSFLKTEEKGEGGEPQFYYAADRVAWHPDTTVGRLGMDVGLFDLIRDRKQDLERKPFYQLLAAVSRAKQGALLKEARAELGKDKGGRQAWTSAASLFNEPDKMRGRLALLTGDVRRAIRIEVRDPDIISRFGVRHYYELYLFTPDSQDNPIVVCVRDLPEGMPIGSGPDYLERIEVAGVLFKSWAFTSGGSALDKEKRQLAPLLIGREPVWIRTGKKSDSPWPGTMAAAGFVIVLFLVWYFLRRQAKGDRAAKERRQNR